MQLSKQTGEKRGREQSKLLLKALEVFPSAAAFLSWAWACVLFFTGRAELSKTSSGHICWALLYGWLWCKSQNETSNPFSPHFCQRRVHSEEKQSINLLDCTLHLVTLLHPNLYSLVCRCAYLSLCVVLVLFGSNNKLTGEIKKIIVW